MNEMTKATIFCIVSVDWHLRFSNEVCSSIGLNNVNIINILRTLD